MKHTPHKKIVNYQIIVDLHHDLDQLLDLQQPLQELADYFNRDDQTKTLEYETTRVTFNNFYPKYQLTITNLKKRLKLLKISEPIKPMPIR